MRSLDYFTSVLVLSRAEKSLSSIRYENHRELSTIILLNSVLLQLIITRNYFTSIVSKREAVTSVMVVLRLQYYLVY